MIAWHPAIQANKLTRIVRGSDDVAFLFQFCSDLELPGIRETSENLQQALSTLLCRFISSDRNPFESKGRVESGVNFVRLKLVSSRFVAADGTHGRCFFSTENQFAHQCRTERKERTNRVSR